MSERVEQLVSTFDASLESGSATTESIQQAFVDMGAVESITESDRLAHLTGTVRLFEAFLARIPLEEGAAMREQRAAIAAIVERKYGPDAPYARSRDIVQQVANRLKRGEDSEAVADGAFAEISALAFDDADADEKGTALIAVNSLRIATDWLAAYDDSATKLDPTPFGLKLYATSLDVGGFNRAAALKSASEIRDRRLSLDGSNAGHVAALMVSVGLALRAEPTALPALSQPILWLAEAVNELQAEANAAAPEAAPASGIAGQCEAITAQFERGLAANGFTEYDFRQAMASIQELSPETPDDSAAMMAALLRVTDLAIAHAPREWADTLAVVRKQIAGDAGDDNANGPTLDLAAFELEAQRVIDRFRSELTGGTTPAAAFAQAQMDLQALVKRLPNGGNDVDDNNEFGRVMMRFMVPLMDAMVPYAEPGKETLAVEVAERFRNALADMEGALGNDSAQTELAGRSAVQQFKTLVEQPLGDPFEKPDAPPYHRQFAAFVRLIAERTFRLNSGDVLGARDAAEWQRIESRLKQASNRITAATTEAQWIEQQRGWFRRAVLDLRRFERRHHLMVIEPSWSGARPAVNPNAVFVSGGSTVQGLVDAAGGELGYESPMTLGINDPTHARWDLLSRSAIAVFDFTSYDRAAADPADAEVSPATMASIAKAAAPTALVAYECGWALALGVPMVSVAREGQLVPFDIDVEPVRLAGDAADVTRVGIALQAALFGTQRGVSAQALANTIERLKALTASDAAAARLIDAAVPADATSVRLAAEGALDRLEGRGLALAFPAFPPAYPSDEGRKALFHVTAFRPWSEACQRVVQEACGDRIERRIGYDRFDPDIIRAIWNDIATASFIVADLTHLNPNAVMELAIAQALGRPTLVVSQTPNLHEHFPPVAKIRIHTYGTDAKGLEGLRAAVDRFVG